MKLHLLVGLILLGGCASAEVIRLKSNPPGALAQVIVEGKVTQSCATPCRLTVDLTDRLVLRFTKEGYHPKSYLLHLELGEAPPFFAHWVYYIPPILFFRAFYYVGRAAVGAYSMFMGWPATIELKANTEEAANLPVSRVRREFR